MKTTRTVNWNLKSGASVQAEITVLRSATPDVEDHDGYMMSVQPEPIESLDINLTIGGKTYPVGTWQIGTVEAGLNSRVPGDAELAKKVQGLGGYAWIGPAVVSQEVYELVMAAIGEATAEAEQDINWKAAKGIADVKKAEKAADEKANIEELQAVEIPQAAVEAYKHYHTAEKAWEAEDEGSWALIKKYEAALKVQIGEFPEELQKEFQAAVAEARYGIRD